MAEIDLNDLLAPEPQKIDLNELVASEEKQETKIDLNELVASEEKQEETVSPTYEGALKETGEGIVSGLIAIPQGIAELGASLIDLAADTDYASDVTQFADELRSDLGVDPEGLAGKITEVATQFVVPGLGAAGAVSKLSKVGKLAKARRTSKADDFVGPKLQAATK